mmetsp:Transcript_14665/g.35761  ORF Transcript_14665/g.35761 Transcript_14665/m.35761 type:complete len:312 (-) Transcript_14665:2315-3250(-)
MVVNSSILCSVHLLAAITIALIVSSSRYNIVYSMPVEKHVHLTSSSYPSFDNRPTLTRSEARVVYDAFAAPSSSPNKNGDGGGKEEIGGNDVESGYGGPAVTSLIEMAGFRSATKVFEFGTGQGKLAALVLDDCSSLEWNGVDQSPLMVDGFRRRCVDRFGYRRCTIELLETGNPSDLLVLDQYPRHSFDRFVSTYVLDLLSEEDMYKVLDLAEYLLDPTNGRLLLAGITWGYRNGNIQTFLMTAIWELLYQIWRTKVGGCRPQVLEPYLTARGWTIKRIVTTLPDGYPWMISECLCATPPQRRVIEDPSN